MALCSCLLWALLVVDIGFFWPVKREDTCLARWCFYVLWSLGDPHLKTRPWRLQWITLGSTRLFSFSFLKHMRSCAESHHWLL